MSTLANNFLRIAWHDIQASKKLYKGELFPQSFFYFQQAAEKANKGFCLLVGSVTEKKVGDIRHKSLKIQREQMVKFKQEMKEVLDMYTHNPWLETSPITPNLNIREYHEKTQSGISSFDKMFNSDLQNISLPVLELTLSELSEMYNTNLPAMPDGYTESFKANMLKYGEWLEKNGKLSDEQKAQMHSDLSNAEMMENVSAVMYKGMEYIIQQSKAYLTIIICSFITTQHVSSTRYPEDGKDPLETYTLKKPVVKLQPKYLALLEKAVDYLLQSTTEKAKE